MERNIAEDESALNELQELGVFSTPATVINGAVVIGFDGNKLDTCTLGIRLSRAATVSSPGRSTFSTAIPPGGDPDRALTRYSTVTDLARFRFRSRGGIPGLKTHYLPSYSLSLAAWRSNF